MIEAAFLGTFIPMLFFLFILRHSRPVLLVFCWGMLAFMLAYYANSALAAAFGLNDAVTVSFFIAPPVEELFKMLPLFFFLFFAQDSFLPFIYIFGAASGIGFAIEENLLYLIAHQTEILSSLVYMVSRSMTTCLMHAMTTALIGFLFTFIRIRKGSWYLLIPAGYLSAVLFHFSYNYLVNSAFSALGILGAFIIYSSGVILMRNRAEQMPEAKDTRWQQNNTVLKKTESV